MSKARECRSIRNLWESKENVAMKNNAEQLQVEVNWYDITYCATSFQ